MSCHLHPVSKGRRGRRPYIRGNGISYRNECAEDLPVPREVPKESRSTVHYPRIQKKEYRIIPTAPQAARNPATAIQLGVSISKSG